MSDITAEICYPIGEATQDGRIKFNLAVAEMTCIHPLDNEKQCSLATDSIKATI